MFVHSLNFECFVFILFLIIYFKLVRFNCITINKIGTYMLAKAFGLLNKLMGRK